MVVEALRILAAEIHAAGVVQALAQHGSALLIEQFVRHRLYASGNVGEFRPGFARRHDLLRIACAITGAGTIPIRMSLLALRAAALDIDRIQRDRGLGAKRLVTRRQGRDLHRAHRGDGESEPRLGEQMLNCVFDGQSSCDACGFFAGRERTRVDELEVGLSSKRD